MVFKRFSKTWKIGNPSFKESNMITGINSYGLKLGKNCNATNKYSIATMSSKPKNGEVDLYCKCSFLVAKLKVTLEVSAVLGSKLYVFPSKIESLIPECGLLFNICIIRLDLQIED